MSDALFVERMRLEAVALSSRTPPPDQPFNYRVRGYHGGDKDTVVLPESARALTPLDEEIKVLRADILDVLDCYLDEGCTQGDWRAHSPKFAATYDRLCLAVGREPSIDP